MEQFRICGGAIGYCLDSHILLLSSLLILGMFIILDYCLDTRYVFHTVQLFRHGGGLIRLLRAGGTAQTQNRAKLNCIMQRVTLENTRL